MQFNTNSLDDCTIMMVLRPADDCPNGFHQRINWGFTARLRFWCGISKEAGSVRELALPESFEDEIVAFAREMIYPPRWWMPWAICMEKALCVVIEKYPDKMEEAMFLMSLLHKIDCVLKFRRMVWECKKATGFLEETEELLGGWYS